MHRITRLTAATCFWASTVAAEQQQFPAAQTVSARLLDEKSGQCGGDNVFDSAFVAFNRKETSLLVTAIVDLGPSCVIHEPSTEEARAIARGERPGPTRPAACERAQGKVLADIRYGDGKHEKQSVDLARFF